VDVCEKYLKKGAKVYVEGQIETRKWTDKDGAEKYSTEIVLRPFNGTITMLGSKGGKSEDDAPSSQEQTYEANKPAAPAAMNDEIPF
jgi:single-strand DNA-binding protein